MGKKSYILLMYLAVSQAFTVKTNAQETVEIGGDKDITEVNKGHMKDDIMELSTLMSATTSGNLWTSPVAYSLDEELEINAKGVILRAFDQFRLKSCIDFKPADSDEYFLSFEKLGGCFSYIGKVISNGQTVSIGSFCDEISTVEHEILHAMGFYHEQSRSDRDDHVTIVTKNIIAGFERNFRKVSGESSTTHDVEYDYSSVMHYGPNAFSNGNGSTILTKDPKYQDVIGQRNEMSPSDIQELNLLYKCNSTIAFQMFCGFSDQAMCEMNHCSRSGIDWKMVTEAKGGPSSDHTTLPSESGEDSEEDGHFLHVRTALGAEGDSAWLETHRMSPNRDCHVQCLQFYYYHSGSKSDQLNIWIREFEDEEDTQGSVRLMGQITGSPTSHWKLHHVPLDADKHFQVEFEVRKGAGSSTGGFSIDDINLSETECPHVTMQVDGFEELMDTSKFGTILYGPRQYSAEGYAYRVATRLARSYFGLYVQLLSGDNDEELEWPCPYRQVTFKVVDQNPEIQMQMSKQRSITTDPEEKGSTGLYVWDNPRNSGNKFTDENGEEVYTGPLVGRTYFASLEDMKFRDFLKGETAVFTFSFQDINPLFEENVLPCPTVKPVAITNPPETPDDGPCSLRMITTTTRPPTTTTQKATTTQLPTTTEGKWTTTMLPATTDGKGQTSKLPATTDGNRNTSELPTTTDSKWTMYTTFSPPLTTDDKSIFGFCPGLAASPLLALLLALLLLIR